MEKLELKHLAPYLPYGLKIWWEQPKEHKQSFFRMSEESGVKEMSVVTMIAMTKGNESYKPILRPLSGLTIELFHKLLPSMPITEEDIQEMKSTPIGHWKYYQVLSALEMHIDIRDLISKGLAIDINTLNNQNS